MINNKPLVSICVPTYNSACYLKEALDSIINQTYNNTEIIVSDNASIDNTEEIAREYMKYGIKFRKNETNIGCYNNYNEFIKIAKGEFIAVYHSNDIYEPNIVEKEVRFLLKNPSAGAVSSLDVFINDDNKIIGRTRLPKELIGKKIYNFSEIYRMLLKYRNSFLRTPTFMVRKFVYDEIGLFNEQKYRTSPDLEMWLRILEKYHLGIINEPLMKYRISETSGSVIYLSEYTQRTDFFSVIDDYCKSSALTERIKPSLWRRYEYYKKLDDLQIAKNLLKKGDVNGAKEVMNSLLSIDFILHSFTSISGIRKLLIAVLLASGIYLGFVQRLQSILKRPTK